MKRALVLSGGGARGAFQVGMLRSLVIDQGLDFHIIRGVSVGSLNGAFLAQASTERSSQENLAAKVAELEAVWRGIRDSDSIYRKRGGFIGLAAGADSLYSVGPLRALMEEHIDIDAIQRSKRDFASGTVSLVSGEYHCDVPTAPGYFEKLVASSLMPVPFPFLDLEDEQDVRVDGGIRDQMPVRDVCDAGADEVYVLLAGRGVRDEDGELPSSTVEPLDYEDWDDNWLGTRISGADVLERTVDILSDEIVLDDIRSAIAWNRWLERVEAVTRAGRADGVREPLASTIRELDRFRESIGKRHVSLFVIAAQRWFVPDADRGEKNDLMNFDREHIECAIEHGVEIAADRSRWLYSSDRDD